MEFMSGVRGLSRLPSANAPGYSCIMQIYTKILLGMAIGTAIGLCLGP